MLLPDEATDEEIESAIGEDGKIMV